MTSTWSVLNGFETPWLIQYDFGPSNYSVWLTDLTHLWTESMDRKRIIQKAFSLDTIIDPSEDASQMRLLLLSMQKAFEQESRTEIEISSEDDGQHISMSLNTTLPAALQPLHWNLVLQRLPQSVVTAKLIVPLLTKQMAANNELNYLLRCLKYKDSIITKLINQMQNDGLDMSKTFPGMVSSRHGGKTNIRQSVGTSIRGLGEFDEHTWRDRMKRDFSMPSDTESLLSRLSPITFTECTEPLYRPNEASRWEGTDRPKPNQKEIFSGLPERATREKKDEESSLDANEFQVRVV